MHTQTQILNLNSGLSACWHRYLWISSLGKTIFLWKCFCTNSLAFLFRHLGKKHQTWVLPFSWETPLAQLASSWLLTEVTVTQLLALRELWGPATVECPDPGDSSCGWEKPPNQSNASLLAGGEGRRRYPLHQREPAGPDCPPATTPWWHLHAFPASSHPKRWVQKHVNPILGEKDLVFKSLRKLNYLHRAEY